jgi:putative ABC transport system permease protein
MLRSYLLTAWRALRRRPGLTALNVLGLGASLGVALLVLFFARDQWRLDRFHPGAEQIHRVETLVEGRPYATAPRPLAQALRDEQAPGVEAAVMLSLYDDAFVTHGETSLGVRAFVAGAGFWDVFTGFRLTVGSEATALTEPGTVVLAERAARELFGDADPVGQTVRWLGEEAHTVVGVLASPPGPTLLDIDLLFPRVRTEDDPAPTPEDWSRVYQRYTFVRLAERASPEALEQAVTGLFRRRAEPEEVGRHAFVVASLHEMRFGGTRSNEIDPRVQVPSWLYAVLGVLAAIGVVAAAFNYVNLTMAQSLRRAREIGVRKTLGSSRGQLVGQFLGEAVLTALMAGAVAAVLFVTLAPAFNSFFLFSFMEVDAVDAAALREPAAMALVALVCVGTGLMAGLYPAVVLSGFQPVTVLRKHGSEAIGTSRVRTLLIAGQVAFSVLLLVTAITFLRQTRHMAEEEHTLRTERLVAVELEDVAYPDFRRAVEGLPDVAHVAATSRLMLGPSNWSNNAIRPPGHAEEEEILRFDVDTSFVANMGVQLVVALPSWEVAYAAREGVILNEAAAHAYGYDRPADLLGQALALPESDVPERIVVAVVENFDTSGIAEVYVGGYLREDMPMLLAGDTYRFALVRSRSGDVAGLRDWLETVWQTRLETKHPFDARFYSDVTRMRYGPLEDAAQMTTAVAGLAIVIALLGLFSLAAHHVQARTKEIGVRKALGARVADVVAVLSRGFAGLVAAAALVAAPAAWMLNRWWLGFFADRVGVSLAVVAACALGLVALALAVIGTQTVRAARLDPVQALRDD